MYYFLKNISDVIGLIGVVLLLLAYFAVSIERLSAKSFTYQILNFLAGWLILFSLYFHWNTPSVMIEIAWIVISMVGIVRILTTK